MGWGGPWTGGGPRPALTPLSMACVWHSVPSAAGMLLVMHRLLLLRHHSSLQTSCGRDARSSSPSSLRRTQAHCRLVSGALGLKASSWILWQGMAWALLSAYIRPALIEHLCVAYIPVDIILPIPPRENQGQVRSLAEGYTATKGQPGYHPRPLTEASMM